MPIEFFYGLIIGSFGGSFIGVLVMSLCFISGKDKRDDE